jgi:hypothetical protein
MNAIAVIILVVVILALRDVLGPRLFGILVLATAVYIAYTVIFLGLDQVRYEECRQKKSVTVCVNEQWRFWK